MEEFVGARSEDCEGAERRKSGEVGEAMCRAGGRSGEREVEGGEEKGGEEWVEVVDGGERMEWGSALA